MLLVYAGSLRFVRLDLNVLPALEYWKAVNIVSDWIFLRHYIEDLILFDHNEYIFWRIYSIVYVAFWDHWFQ